MNTINIEQLNNQFGLPNQLGFITGQGGFPFLQINTEKATALISIYGGQILKFKPVAAHNQLLFNSNNAYYREGKAIKGGVPICWPWFGAAPDKPENPDHGLVRNHYWSMQSTELLNNGDIKVSLVFVDNQSTMAVWPYQFYLSLNFIIGDTLTIQLLTRNTGNQAFTITEALHSYFEIGDITQTLVQGLENTDYLDKGKDFVKTHQQGEVNISEATDHIFLNTQKDLMIIDPILNRAIKIKASGSNNVVVWNPWLEGATAMADLADDDYKHFICVETANVGSDEIEILPNAEHSLQVKYKVTEL